VAEPFFFFTDYFLLISIFSHFRHTITIHLHDYFTFHHYVISLDIFFIAFRQLLLQLFSRCTTPSFHNSFTMNIYY